MFGKSEKAALEARIAELEKANADLQHQLDTVELSFYKALFGKINFNIEGSISK